jgi:hypothetical protein
LSTNFQFLILNFQFFCYFFVLVPEKTKKAKTKKSKNEKKRNPRMCLCGRRQTRRRCAECGRESARYETAVRDVLASDYRLAGFAWDTRAISRQSKQSKQGKDNQCTRRPDFLWMFDGACVVLEVDENEHRDYDAADEEARVDEIERALGRRVAWVRLRIARGAPIDAVRARVEESADIIAELISLARKKVGDSQTKTKKSVTLEVK